MMNKPFRLLPLLGLLFGGCSSMSGSQPLEAGPRYSEVARILNIDQESPGDLRIWVDTSIAFPYRTFLLDLDSRTPRVRSFLWWPYEDGEGRRYAEEHMRQDCPAALVHGSDFLACPVSAPTPLTKDALGLAVRLRDSLRHHRLPGEIGSPTEARDGTTMIVLDGTSVEVQIHPFDDESRALFDQPDTEYCEDPLCELVASLVRQIESER